MLVLGVRFSIARGVRDYFARHGPRRLVCLDSGGAIPDDSIVGPTAGAIVHNGAISRHGLPVSENVPLVTVGYLDDDTPYVVPDYAGRGELAGEHFHELRLTDFAFVGQPGNEMSEAMVRGLARSARRCGAAMHLFGENIHGALTVGAPEQRKLDDWLSELPRPVGLVSMLSHLACFMELYLQQRGEQIPGEVAIVSACPAPMVCSLATPPISYVQDNDWQMGYEAARLLNLQLHGRAARGRCVEVPPVRICEQASTDLLAVDDARLVRAVRYLREQALGKVTVEEIARHAGLSRRSLEQRIQQHLGVSVHEEITRVRIQRAKQLLGSSNLSLTEIALACGLEWATSLGNLFRKREGLSPGQYRKEIRRRIRGE